MEKVETKVAAELKQLRQSAGVTQIELARRMKTTQSIIARIESGKHAISFSTAEEIANALHYKMIMKFEKK